MLSLVSLRSLQSFLITVHFSEFSFKESLFLPSILIGFGVGSIDGRVALKFLDQSKSGAKGSVFCSSHTNNLFVILHAIGNGD